MLGAFFLGQMFLGQGAPGGALPAIVVPVKIEEHYTGGYDRKKKRVRRIFDGDGSYGNPNWKPEDEEIAGRLPTEIEVPIGPPIVMEKKTISVAKKPLLVPMLARSYGLYKQELAIVAAVPDYRDLALRLLLLAS